MSFIQQYRMRKGLKTFGRETGMKCMTKEIEQLYQRNSFKPINVSSIPNYLLPKVQKESVQQLSVTKKKDVHLWSQWK